MPHNHQTPFQEHFDTSATTHNLESPFYFPPWDGSSLVNTKLIIFWLIIPNPSIAGQWFWSLWSTKHSTFTSFPRLQSTPCSTSSAQPPTYMFHWAVKKRKAMMSLRGNYLIEIYWDRDLAIQLRIWSDINRMVSLHTLAAITYSRCVGIQGGGE